MPVIYETKYRSVVKVGFRLLLLFIKFALLIVNIAKKLSFHLFIVYFELLQPLFMSSHVEVNLLTALRTGASDPYSQGAVT